ncbi:MAG: hypothetical protein K0S12_2477, partial [Bacteroidetes bacterium]|nr:hypothetical protein [Bacteroidota bacterium]
MLLQKNSWTKTDLLLTGISFAILLTYTFNFFYDLNNLLVAISISLVAMLGVALIVRYKQFLLYSLAFLVPLSVPITVGGGTKMSLPSELICALLSVFFFIKLWQKKKLSADFLKHPITLLILADLCWLLITSCTSEMPMVSFKRLLIKLMYYISFYYFYYELFRMDTNQVRKVFGIHCVGMLIPIASATFFHAGLGFTTMGSQLASAPFYNDHTMYGAALVFFIPFLVFHSFKRFSGSHPLLMCLLLLIFLASAFLSYSRAAWLSLIVSTLIGLLIYFKPRTHHIVLLLSVVITILFLNRTELNDYFTRNKDMSHNNDVSMHFKSMSNINSDASNLERVNRWKCAFRMFEDKPLFGFGPGTYQFFYG